MVSRPLESPRKSAYEPFCTSVSSVSSLQFLRQKCHFSRSYGPEIGDVHEGIVEGSEYAGYAEDEFT
jgi:hypothetical protein